VNSKLTDTHFLSVAHPALCGAWWQYFNAVSDPNSEFETVRSALDTLIAAAQQARPDLFLMPALDDYFRQAGYPMEASSE
jgi:hypothetical protein